MDYIDIGYLNIAFSKICILAFVEGKQTCKG